MSTWECEECGATASDAQRKNCIQDACDQRCKWVRTTQATNDDESEDEE